jgi:hypothetical protein
MPNPLTYLVFLAFSFSFCYSFLVLFRKEIVFVLVLMTILPFNFIFVIRFFFFVLFPPFFSFASEELPLSCTTHIKKNTSFLPLTHLSFSLCFSCFYSPSPLLLSLNRFFALFALKKRFVASFSSLFSSLLLFFVFLLLKIAVCLIV